jgi:hypothetical protein
MDAKEYDRIADLLMQIRKKYAKGNHHMAKYMVERINYLLIMNDKIAEQDGKGWL